jgi:hypothetical protein
MMTLSFGPMPTLPELTDGGLADITGGVETTDGALLADTTDGALLSERTDGAEHTDGFGISSLLGRGGEPPRNAPPVSSHPVVSAALSLRAAS